MKRCKPKDEGDPHEARRLVRDALSMTLEDFESDLVAIARDMRRADWLWFLRELRRRFEESKRRER